MFPFYQTVFGSLTFLLAMYYKKFEAIDQELVYPSVNPTVESYLPKKNEYDFIICGGGTAGLALANRLSLNHHVLVLETGGDPLPPTYVPANFPLTFWSNYSAHIWTSVKQTQASLGIDDGIVTMHQGRALGGSSTINGMSYNRGNPKDWDLWANMTGDPTWGYDQMLKYFKMNENFYQEETYNDHLGYGGAMAISKNEEPFNEEEHRWYQLWKEAGIELGYETYENPNGPQKEGFGSFTLIKQKGKRFGAFEGFLRPILNRPTLTISRYSQVTQLDIDENKRAVGVLYTRHGVNQYAMARKEIIVSAGTFNTPLILMRSGVGPKDQLQAAGIEVKADLPVGKFYHDHPGLWLTALQMDGVKDLYENPDQKLIDLFVEEGLGPLANYWHYFGQAFIVSSVAKEEGHPDWPDIQYLAFYNSTNIFGGDNTIGVFVSIGRPKSLGSFALNTTHPHEAPLIWNPNYLSNERDLKVLIEGLKLALKLVQTKAFSSIGGKIYEEPWPACKSHGFGSDLYWECLARQLTKHIWHPVGSCRMGRSDDQDCVVDPQLKVKGITGLRLCDNSIMPHITNGNTMAPALATAQKAAEMILTEHYVKMSK